MSFRETRNLSEKLRVLGFPIRLTLDSFRNPNMKLVADIMKWLLKVYDPNAELPFDIDTEQDRIIFVRSIAAYLASKAQLKLNTKKLYSADGLAVQEILQFVDIVYQANQLGASDSILTNETSMSFDTSRHLSILKTCKMLAMDITRKAPGLHEILQKEVELREARADTISRQLDMKEIQKSITGIIAQTQSQTDNILKNVETMKSEEENLRAKLDKKKQELDRREKRLKSLKGVRPAFMDEYDRIETELKSIYETYVENFRNITYLEHFLRDLEDKDLERIREKQDSVKKMVAKMEQEELHILREDAQMTAEETKKLMDDVANDLASEGSLTPPADASPPRRSSYLKQSQSKKAETSRSAKVLDSDTDSDDEPGIHRGSSGNVQDEDLLDF